MTYIQNSVSTLQRTHPAVFQRPSSPCCMGYCLWMYFYSMARQLLIVKVSRSHSDTPHSTWLPWKSHRTVAHFYQTTHKQHTPAGFEPAVPASERLQILALDSAVTGNGSLIKIQSFDILRHTARTVTIGCQTAKYLRKFWFLYRAFRYMFMRDRQTY
jgi:hypothetical protein